MRVRLSEHLPLLAEAPDGNKKLRGLILELAVRGKLVPQDPNDEPASKLLQRITKERALLEAEGARKKSKPTPPMGGAEQPFDLNVGWSWVRLGTIGNIYNGNSINAIEKEAKYTRVGGRPFIATKDVGYGLAPLDYYNGVHIPESESQFRVARKNTVFLCAEGGSAGKKCGITDRDVCFGNKLFANEPFAGIPARFILYVYLSPTFRSEFEKVMTGIIGGVSIAKFVELPFPLPPLAEQHRIVAKVDELMALCDRMEAEQAGAEAAQATLVQTLLGTLTQSRDAAELAANWQRLSQHFDTLFTTEGSLDALKQALLQLAVMGKLVPQNPSDEPASELLKRIADERVRLETEGKIRKSKPQPPVGDDDQPHPIPDNWAYVRLQELCSTITDGTHQTPRYTENGRPFLSAQNVKPFRFMPEKFRYVSEEDYQGYVKATKPELGDVLLTRVGAMIGEAAVIDRKIDFAIYVSLALLKPLRPFVSPEFITLWLNSPSGTHSSIRDTLGRGVSAGNLNLGLIRAFTLPLPPTNEQLRIVAKVDELMALCDSLKADLAESCARQARLATTLIETALQAA